MNGFKIYCLMFVSMSFLCISNLNAQSIDSTEVSNNFSDDDIVEAGESIIKIEVEKPQVQLFSQRIKPEFDEVNLDKSFIKEIVDLGQIIELKESNKNSVKLINVEQILNKSR